MKGFGLALLTATAYAEAEGLERSVADAVTYELITPVTAGDTTWTMDV